MATLISNTDTQRSLNHNAVLDSFEHKLGDGIVVWHKMPVGENGFIPDYLILHPNFGLLIVVEKHWDFEFLCSEEFERKAISNPLAVVETYAKAIRANFSRDPILSGCSNGGMLPVQTAVLLPELNSTEFDQSVLRDVIDSSQVLCADDFNPERENYLFSRAIENLFADRLMHTMTQRLFDRVRWHCFPSLRISEHVVDVDGCINVLDLQKEQHLRNPSASLHFIHGVSGSGKTTLLLHRCRRMQRARQSALVLCFSNVLAAETKFKISLLKLDDTIHVMSLEDWCRNVFKRADVAFNVRRKLEKIDRIDRMVEQLQLGIAKEQVKSFAYDAVLIDEAHDFKQSWLNLVEQLSDGASQYYFYDSAQGSRFKMFDDIDEHAEMLELEKNYRNTSQIIELAREFVEDKKLIPDTPSDKILKLTGSGKQGDLPELIRKQSLHAEIDYMFGRLNEYHESGLGWNRMALICRSAEIGQMIESRLGESGIPADLLIHESVSYHPQSNTVKVLSLEQAKGLEFEVVVMPGLGHIGKQQNTYVEDLQLIYMGMTRATQHLIMSYHRHTPFVARLKNLTSSTRISLSA